MLHLNETVTIAASPSAVFSWIANPERARRWQPDVKAYEVTRATPELVGTEFREWLGDGTGSLEMHGRITRCLPDEAIEFEVGGAGVEVRSRYLLTAAADGTALRAELDFRLRSRFSFLLEPFLRQRIRRQMHRELQTLCELCDAERVTDPHDQRTRTGAGA